MDKDISVITYNYNVSAEQMVRFHLLSYTRMNDIDITRTEMNALVLLGLWGKPDLKEFSLELVRRGVYLSEESARNAIGKLCTDKGLVHKDGAYRKKVMLSPDLKVTAKPGTMLTINCIHGTKEA